MKSKGYLLLLMFCFLQFFACKKETKPNIPLQHAHSLENGLLTFSINGELGNATIDTVLNTITVVIPHTLSKSNLTVNFSLSNQVDAIMENVAATSGISHNFNSPVNFVVTSTDKTRSTSYQVTVQTDYEYMGLTGIVTEEKSLNKNYNFYFDQFDGSLYQDINCSPAVVTMAIKWVDSTFTKTPVDVRNTIHPQGGLWYPEDIQAYLTSNGLDISVDTLSNIDSCAKANIKNGNLVILVLNMYYVPINTTIHQHTQKFYITPGDNAGHCILIKGYRQTTQGLYFEAYDPFSNGATYTGIYKGQLRGIDRYYLSSGLKAATDNYWTYAIIVHPYKKNPGIAMKPRINNMNKIK